MRRTLLAAAALLLAAPAAASAEEVYQWNYELRSYSHAKSVCGQSGKSRVFTEVVTQEIFNRGSGVSHVGNGRGLPRGSSIGSGRIRRMLSKKQEDVDGTVLYEDGVVTEQLPTLPANWGAVNGTKDGRRTLDVVGLEDGQSFSRLKKSQSITITVNETSPPGHSDDGQCVVDSTGTVTGTITIKRVK